ncbi:MAG: hypothetical protein JWM04_633 [Verrucomicrobiales bacterium]|nr:hypothetical protein [Verrucomicrobiales bacterium]
MIARLSDRRDWHSPSRRSENEASAGDRDFERTPRMKRYGRYPKILHELSHPPLITPLSHPIPARRRAYNPRYEQFE